MGTIYARKSRSDSKKIVSYRAEVLDAKGQRVRESFASRGAAERWVRAQEVRKDEDRALLASGRKLYDQTRTLRHLIDKYSEEVLPSKRGERRERLMLQAFMRNNPNLADAPLARLTTAEWAAWRDRRAKERSPNTVVREMGILSHAYNTARREWGWVEQNPLSDVRRPSAGAPRERRPSDDEIERLKAASGYEPNQPPTTSTARSIAAFLFCCETGLRAGELCKLKWTDVKEDAGWLGVVGKVNGVAQTKTGYSRTVPLTAEARRLLKQLHPVTKASRLVIDLRPNSLDALFRKVRDRAGLTQGVDEDLHFHDSRREALTRLAKIYLPQELAKISGHMDLKILLNTYYAPTADDLTAKLRAAEEASTDA